MIDLKIITFNLPPIPDAKDLPDFDEETRDDENPLEASVSLLPFPSNKSAPWVFKLALDIGNPNEYREHGQLYLKVYPIEGYPIPQKVINEWGVKFKEENGKKFILFPLCLVLHQYETGSLILEDPKDKATKRYLRNLSLNTTLTPVIKEEPASP